MEENKIKVSPVSQEVVEGATDQKMTYEQLENIAHQLSEQARQLYAKLQAANMENVFKRLDYLFKVVENSPSFKTAFVNSCAEEIENLITVPDTEESEGAE